MSTDRIQHHDPDAGDEAQNLPGAAAARSSGIGGYLERGGDTRQDDVALLVACMQGARVGIGSDGARGRHGHHR